MVISKKNLLLIIIFTIFIGCSTSCTTPFNELQTDNSFETLQFSEVENNFTISSFVINDEYTVLDKSGQEEVIDLTYHNIEDIFYAPNLLGYDSNNVYILHYENDNILVSRIDYNAKHIDRNIYKSKANIIFSKIIKNGLLYLGEAELLDGQLRSVLKRINLQGEDDELFEEIVFQCTYTKFPDINYSEDYVLINYSNYEEFTLGYMNHNDNKFIEIFRSDYTVNEGYLYTGKIPLYGNGDKKGIYFQVISLDNEAIDFEGNQELYYYSFADDKYMPKLILSDKTTYINGNSNIIILDDYAVDNPRTITGKIISFIDNTVTSIPKTSPVNGIKDSIIKEDLIFVSSNENIYVFNQKKQTYTSMDIGSHNRTEIRIYDDTFGYMNMIDGELVFHLIRYNKG